MASQDVLSGLKSIAEVGTIFVALTFVAGWSYITSYYVMFGLNPFELDLSVQSTSAFAIQMLWNSGWLFPLSALVLVGLMFQYRRLGNLRQAWAAAGLTALLFAAATAGTLRGRSLAREDMYETSSRLPNVGFVSRTKGLEPDCLGEGTTDCKLLLHSKGIYYFFVPIPSTTFSSVSNRSLNVYMISDPEVLAVHILRGIE